MSRGLPITLTHLDTRLCVVIGGGQVAERKVQALLEAGAKVRVIAPQLTGPLAGRARVGEIEWSPRAYRSGDLDDAFLVIAATGDGVVNRAIAAEAAARDLLVNVVDDAACSDFISPAVVRRGDMTIAICTGGAAPALSRSLRTQMEQEFGTDWEAYVEWLAQIRPLIAARYPDMAARQQAWAHVVASDLRTYIASHAGDEIQNHLDQILDY
jgi:siroheme synthase-like protein